LKNQALSEAEEPGSEVPCSAGTRHTAQSTKYTALNTRHFWFYDIHNIRLFEINNLFIHKESSVNPGLFLLLQIIPALEKFF
jgi:hypothetical protein